MRRRRRATRHASTSDAKDDAFVVARADPMRHELRASASGGPASVVPPPSKPDPASAVSPVSAAPQLVTSAGHVMLVSAHDSAGSHAPVEARQVIVAAISAASGAQVPSAPPVSAAEHAWQSSTPPPHSVAQHTPST